MGGPGYVTIRCSTARRRAVNPTDIIAGDQRVAALSAAGSLVLPTAAYPLDEVAQAWEAQASAPGKKIAVIP